MRLVILQREVFVLEREDVLHVGIELHLRQRIGAARKLLARLIEVVQIEMRVAERVNELAGLQSSDLRDHHGEQRVRGDVEGNAQENVRRALIKLAGEFSGADVKLKQAVTRRQRHLFDLSGVPRADDQPPR